MGPDPLVTTIYFAVAGILATVICFVVSSLDIARLRHVMLGQHLWMLRKLQDKERVLTDEIEEWMYDCTLALLELPPGQ